MPIAERRQPRTRQTRDPFHALLEQMVAELTEQIEDAEARRELLIKELQNRGVRLRVVPHEKAAEIAAPRQRRRSPTVVSDEALRDFVEKWKTFTRQDVEEKLGISNASAIRKLRIALDYGWIRKHGYMKAEGEKGKGKVIYEWIDPAKLKGPRSRPRHHLDLGRVASQATGQPVKQRRKPRTKDKRTNELLETAEEQGWTLERTGVGHIRARPPHDPKGKGVHVASTPGTYNRGYENALAEFRRLGLIFGRNGNGNGSALEAASQNGDQAADPTPA